MNPEEVHKHIKIINGEKVFDGGLNLGWNNLNSLKSYDLSDVIITGGFACDRNILTSLKGSPKQVVGNFYCYNNKLTSLEGLSETIGGFIVIEKEVLQRLYFTNPIVALYAMKNKFYFV